MLHTPRKRFGQHFLTDEGVIHQILHAINPKSKQTLVEIGPGMSALTQPLVERLGSLTVIELDRDLVLRLKLHPQLNVVACDVLKVDFHGLAQDLCAAKLRIVGNLPYNISSPILFHLLNYIDVVEDQHFMLQREVVQRMLATPCHRDYGRLTVMLQWRYSMEHVLDVPPESFDPPPRVDSAVVRMQPLSQCVDIPLKFMEDMLRIAFSQKRKLVRHTLGRWLEQQGFIGNFDVQRRAEEIPVTEYIALAQTIYSEQKVR